MAKTSVDIDMEKLVRVREILGTKSIREAVNAAFREVIRVAAVRDPGSTRRVRRVRLFLEPGAEEHLWG
jgi:Arc/MetJ family transcription regulator